MLTAGAALGLGAWLRPGPAGAPPPGMPVIVLMQLLPVPGNEQATFRDPGTQAAVRDFVKRVLNLR